MSKIALTPNASGTGVFTIASPATSTDRTLTLPDEAGTVLTSVSSLASANLVDDSITSAKLTGDAVPIGVGQNWTDVSGSRSQNVTYYNTTGHPIEVSVTSTYPTSGNAYVNGVWVVTILSISGQRSTVSFIVPNGHSYLYTAGIGAGWSELR